MDSDSAKPEVTKGQPTCMAESMTAASHFPLTPIHSLWTNIGRDRHEWMITRTRLCTTVMLFEAKRAAVNQRPFQTACYLSGQITSG